MFGRKKVAVIIAEFLGTYVLASAVMAMAGRTGFPFFAAAAAGLSLAGMALIIGPISGSHINPAVTLGLWTQRKIPTTQAIAYVAAQMLAGLSALHINQYLINQTFPNTATKNWDWRILLAEAIGTFVFTFGVAAAVYNVHEGGKLAATLGISLFVGVLLASFGSAGALNPAVALGVNAWSASYVLGPLAGGILGMNFYVLLFAPTNTLKRSKRKK